MRWFYENINNMKMVEAQILENVIYKNRINLFIKIIRFLIF